MENKKFIENYIMNEVKKGQQNRWAWVINSELSNEKETLSFNPSSIQHALIKRPQKGKLTMNAICRRYAQLEKLYKYGEEHGQVKFNPFRVFELVSLQEAVDMYYLANKERYLTKENINEFLYCLSDNSRIHKNVLLNTTLVLIAAYHGVSKLEIMQLKVSDFDLDKKLLILPNGNKKPIDTELVDMIKYYLWQTDSDLFFEDYLIAGKEQYSNIEEYKKNQKSAVSTAITTIKKFGDWLGFGLVQIQDIMYSGFIRYLKANMDMDTIIDIYSIHALGNEKDIRSVMFFKVAIEYYYRFCDYYPTGKNFTSRQGNEIIGNTIGYLYQDKEYYDCKSQKLVDETFH